ncbi:MAG: transporter substrate-binding domain-containing protein [Spirochaetota bacterium]
MAHNATRALRRIEVIIIFFIIMCTSLHARQKEIHVAASIYEPFVIEKDGRLSGFDVDLLELICRINDIKYTITLTSFQNMLQMVKDGHADMAIGCIYMTESRMKDFAYSQPYLEGGLVMAVQSQAIVDGLEGAKIGVKHNATGDLYVQSLVDKGRVVQARRYKSTMESFRALQKGEVDIVLNNFYNSIFLIQRYFPGEISLAKDMWGVKIIDQHNIGFAINTDKQWLNHLVNDELAEMKKSGIFDTLYSKWFTVPYPVSSLYYLLMAAGILISVVLLSAAISRYRNRKMRIRYQHQTGRHFKTLVKDLPVGIFLIRDGNIIMTNREGLRLLGTSRLEDALNSEVDAFFSEYTILYNEEQSESCSRLSHFLNEPPSGTDTSGVPVYNANWIRSDGNTISLIIRSRLVDWLDGHAHELVIQDMSTFISLHDEKEKLHEQLTQSQKFEAVGKLAGGIAHDFNNILTVIQGYAELITVAEENNESGVNAKIITESCQRASDLTSKLLTFSRRSSYKTVPLHLHEIIDEIIIIIRRTFPRSITIKVHADAGDDLVFGNANQVHQSIMNIAINARDAMPDGGTLTMSTDNTTINRKKITKFGIIKPGKYIRLRITDTGSGIPHEQITHIFEPFFTTKANGKGTGLGLSLAYGTVSQHKGFIDVDSRSLAGTTFTIYFPLYDGPQQLENEEKIATDPKITGEGNVVIIDDELYITNYLQRVISDAGYSVTTFTSPLDALDYIQLQHEKIDILLLDMIMPHMQGDEVFDRVKNIKKDLPVIIMSGFTSKNTPNQMLERGAAAFISKPIQLDHLLRIVKDVLEK